MVSAFLKYIDDQQQASAKQRTDNLALQQQQFANGLAEQANNRANTSAALTNKLNKVKLGEADRLVKVRSAQKDMYDVLARPDNSIKDKEQDQIDGPVLKSFGVTTGPYIGPSRKNTEIALQDARNTPEAKALYTANIGHISQNTLDTRKANAIQMAINAGATPTEAETSANTIISSLYGAKYTAKDIQAKKDYNLKMFSALYPTKSGNNVTINSDGTVSTNGKAGKNYNTIGYNDNFDPVDFDKQMQSYKQYMGTSSLFPDFQLFNAAHKAIVVDTPTSSIKYMEQGIAEANKQRALIGLPNINTSSAVRIMAAMPKNEHWFISNGFKNSKNLTQFGAAINLAASKFGSDNAGN